MSTSVDLLDLMDIPQRASMNDDLASFIDGQDPVDGTRAPERENKQGRPVRGPCGFCSHPAVAACLRCERTACSRHRHAMTGLCPACMRPQEGSVDAPSDEAPTSERPDLGISWVD